MTDLVAPQVLETLKDFQRSTVEHVFSRLYDTGGSGRFLVADEVGLGKTMIAKGVIAKAIDRLRELKVPRIDVVYICSNADIARQNINRLRVGDADTDGPVVTRLTMLPRHIAKLKASKSGVNFISFTPSTSFDVHDGLGEVHERVLLYFLLREAWGLGTAKGPMNVFQGHASPERFRHLVNRINGEQKEGSEKKIDADTSQAFTNGVNLRGSDLRARFDELCEAYKRTDVRVDPALGKKRYRFVGELRGVLAESCVAALEPDLIVLDEFQRFGHLLHGEDDASKLSRAMFNHRDAKTNEKVRVLMLSATPYKMYTTSEETIGDDHYRDFVRTLGFLQGDELQGGVEQAVGNYREALLSLGQPQATEKLASARGDLQTRLRDVMVRTERLASTADRNGMLVEVPSPSTNVRESDLQQYLSLSQVARELEADDVLELWKSSPYILNFADDNYKVGRKLRELASDGAGRQRLAKTLSTTGCTPFPVAAADEYAEIDPGNARMRRLIADVVDDGAYRLLWVPPSLPYYQLGGVYAAPELRTFTKRLVFSSWRMVPRAIAAIVSYAAERRMVENDKKARPTSDSRDARSGRLNFSVQKGSLAGMPVLALLYPSLYLAKACDPAVLVSGEGEGEQASLADVLQCAREFIEVGLRRLGETPAEGPVDERWYWAAPLLLDRQLRPDATRAWFEQPDLAAAWSGKAMEKKKEEDGEDGENLRESQRPPPTESDGWEKHVEQAKLIALSGTGTTVRGEALGRMPENLVDVLAELAVAGPAVAMFRALDRVVGGEADPTMEKSVLLRNGAGATAWAFRSLFNRPEVMPMVRGSDPDSDTPYWRRVLDYCAQGCLPAVLDEYVHVLRDHLGLMTGAIGSRVKDIASEISAALSLRAANVSIENYVLSDAGRTLRAEKKNLRIQYAVRFADEKNEDGNEVTRSDQIRKAFNSPFWPFVLATTSVGQEGLDFHPFCHSVVHWNLPSNPVDLEQREGRVHRYKGHAVRKNVAQLHGSAALQGENGDFWEAMFRAARDEAKKTGASEIVPFWVYPVEGGARIERHVYALPLSREQGQAARLRHSLSLYRMVFGQPRQEDLLRYLAKRIDPSQTEAVSLAARIDLAPAPVS